MYNLIHFGLKRSGNHGFMNWVISSSNTKKYVHINNLLAELKYSEYLHYKKVKMTVSSIDCKYTGFNGAKLLIISLENVNLRFSESSSTPPKGRLLSTIVFFFEV